jgi:hypothetical protein
VTSTLGISQHRSVDLLPPTLQMIPEAIGKIEHRDRMGAVTQSPPAARGEGSVVCLGDAFDDCQAEADTCVVGAYAFGAAKKRLDKHGNQLWGDVLSQLSGRS